MTQLDFCPASLNWINKIVYLERVPVIESNPNIDSSWYNWRKKDVFEQRNIFIWNWLKIFEIDPFTYIVEYNWIRELSFQKKLFEKLKQIFEKKKIKQNIFFQLPFSCLWFFSFDKEKYYLILSFKRLLRWKTDLITYCWWILNFETYIRNCKWCNFCCFEWNSWEQFLEKVKLENEIWLNLSHVKSITSWQIIQI